MKKLPLAVLAAALLETAAGQVPSIRAMNAGSLLLLVASQASGTVALIDLAGNRVVETINAVGGEGETTAHDAIGIARPIHP